MNPNSHIYPLLIASYLEPEFVERIRQVDGRLEVIYEPRLLPESRYPADHHGKPLARNSKDEETWRKYLAQAEIMFSFDYTHLEDLPDLTPNLRWLQATSAGIGQFIKNYRYHERLPDTIFTTASGVHVRPLAEFVVMAMLMHYKKLLHVVAEQPKKHWARFSGTDLEGRTIGIVGLGHAGSEVARITHLLGMRTFGTDLLEKIDVVDRYYPISSWQRMLPELDVLVICVPQTPRTEKIVGRKELTTLSRDAYLINISRGVNVDEDALIEVLRNGEIAGAALDVFRQEPLPPESPLWDMPNVLVNPHSASTSDRENARLTDLFCDNIERFLTGQPLRNVLEHGALY